MDNIVSTLVDLLQSQPLFLLFVIIIIGYPIGRIKIGGFSLGVSSILFSGLAVGGLSPDLKLPDIIYLFGLVLFVYSIGISTGETFFSSFKKDGLKDNLLSLGTIMFIFLLFLLIQSKIHLKGSMLAGMFAGTLTNTPALAQVLDYLKMLGNLPYSHDLLSEPVVAYSICYPMGVIGMIIAILLCQRMWKTDYNKEATETMAGNEPVMSLSVLIEKNFGITITNLKETNKWEIAFGRVLRDGKYKVASPDMQFEPDDIVSMVGTKSEIERVMLELGKKSDLDITFDHTNIDFRRIFVSNPKVSGKKIGELDTLANYGAVVTRIRRGDVDLVPNHNTVLQPGDRVRVVCDRQNIPKVSQYLGDSYKELSEFDVLTLSSGIGLGILIGMIPIYSSDTITIKLGVAGGPLLVALVLGYFGRTGPIAWSLPYSVNLTLRQLGIILFLAGVGCRAGYSFFDTIRTGGIGYLIFAIGALLTFITAILFLFIGHKWMKIPMGRLIGMLAGMQTQPALLGFANEQAKNDLPNNGYASVYPLATIIKIILAQILLTISF